MAVSISIYEANTAGEVESLLAANDSLTFGRTDAHIPDALVRPLRGIKRSYEKYLKVKLAGMVATETISNLQLITSSSAPAGGVTIEAGVHAAYAAPVGTDSAKATTSLFNYTANAPLLITDADVTYAVDNLADNQVALNDQLGKYLVLQMDITSIALIGAIATSYDPMSIIIRYDES